MTNVTVTKYLNHSAKEEQVEKHEDYSEKRGTFMFSYILLSLLALCFLFAVGHFPIISHPQ